MNEKKGIVFEDVNKSYGHNQVVHHLNLSIREGERLILLGPSGCGKTTTLRMIAGLEKITTGKLIMGDKIVNELDPGERNVAMVFQNYALYPHMSVWENITFGLSLQKLPLDEIKRRTQKALEILHLTGYEQRKPSELSGGQKQRVALGRAIVKQAPYFLLDEPLSNLDAQLRLQARTELVKIHEVYRPTMVYVTHDQVEAMTIGQRIAILYQGTLQQVDAPEVLYRNPANTFVASFIGAPPMNLLAADFQEGALWLDHTRLNVPLEWQPLLAEHPQIFVGLRPELCHPDSQSPLNGRIELVELLGAQRCLHIRLPQTGQKVLCLIPAEQPIPSGDIKIAFSWNTVNLFDRQSGLNIGKPCDLSASLVS